jgi:hypothetical protein
LNQALRPWSADFGEGFGLDHVTLRRYLINGKNIVRDRAGSSYALNEDEFPITFETSITRIDLKKLIEETNREREERKRLYTQSTKV